MAIAFRANTTNFNNFTVTSVTCNKPAGTASGDILVATIRMQLSGTPGTVTPPSGWTEITHIVNTGPNAGDPFYLYMYWLRAGTSEPASYTWSWVNSANANSTISGYSGGVSSGSPIDVTATTTNGSSSSDVVAPSITTTNANEMVVFGLDNETGASWTAASGTTIRSGGSTFATQTADHAAASAGSTGTFTFLSGTGDDWGAITTSLLPASSGTPALLPTRSHGNQAVMRAANW